MNTNFNLLQTFINASNGNINEFILHVYHKIKGAVIVHVYLIRIFCFPILFCIAPHVPPHVPP